MTPDYDHLPPNVETHTTGVHLTGRDFAAMALLVASVAGMFWKVIFTQAMFFYRDIYNYTYPSARFIHDLCHQGFLPYWNPYLNYGQQVLANPNLLFFYPYTLLIVLLPVDIAYSLHFPLHFAVAGIGTYLLVHRWGQTRVAAFFAAFVFVFSGPVLSLGDLYNQCACAAWIPWAMLAVDRALESKLLRSWALLIVVFSLQWLAGEPMTFLATFGLTFAYALFRAGTRDKLWSKANLRIVGIFFLLGCGVLLLCAVQTLPAADLLSHSRRGVQGLRFRETANWAIHPLAILAVLIPDFFGSGIAAPTSWLWFVSDRNLPYLLSLFLGFVPLFLALAGWRLGRHPHRNFAAGAAGTFLILSFGHFTPVFSLAYLLFPPLMVVRYPAKLLVLVAFLVSILAGWGLDVLRSDTNEWRARHRRVLAPLATFLGLVLLILAAAWLLPAVIMAPARGMLQGLGRAPFATGLMPDALVTMLRFELPGLVGFGLGGLVVLIGLEQQKKWARPALAAFALIGMGQLVAANYPINPTVPKSFFTYRPTVLSEINYAPGAYRVSSNWPITQTPDTKNLQTYVSFESVPEARDLDPVAQGAFQTRTQLAAGSMVNEVEGDINLDLERSLPPYLYDVEIYLSQKKADPLHADCLLGRTNVKYVLRTARADSAATRFIGDVSNGSPLPSRLYEDACFVPRAYVAGNTRFSTDSVETLDLLASPDFDALNTVILAPLQDSSLVALPFGAAPAGLKPGATAVVARHGVPLQSGGPSSTGHVDITGRTPNSVTLQAQLTRPGYVVLLERYDPGWQATVDGHTAPVLRANQIFRAVYVEAGQHQIRFEYHQRGLRAGLAVSLLTAATLLVLCFSKVRI